MRDRRIPQKRCTPILLCRSRQRTTLATPTRSSNLSSAAAGDATELSEIPRSEQDYSMPISIVTQQKFHCGQILEQLREEDPERLA